MSGWVWTVSSSKADRSGMMLDCCTTTGVEGLSGQDEDEEWGVEAGSSAM